MRITLILFIIFIVAQLAMYARTDEPDTALWLARSCVGEAGFNAYQTGECATILSIYAKRSALTGESILQNAKRYSAAIKNHRQKRNPWVNDMDRTGEVPDRWPLPKRVWEQRYRARWVINVMYAELFLLGFVEDPYPEAMHYGSPLDTPPKGARLIKTNYRNRIYTEVRPWIKTKK